MAIKHLSTMWQVFKKLTICRKELPVTTCKGFVSCDYCIYFHVFPQTIQHLWATIYFKKKKEKEHTNGLGTVPQKGWRMFASPSIFPVQQPHQGGFILPIFLLHMHKQLTWIGKVSEITPMSTVFVFLPRHHSNPSCYAAVGNTWTHMGKGNAWFGSKIYNFIRTMLLIIVSYVQIWTNCTETKIILLVCCDGETSGDKAQDWQVGSGYSCKGSSGIVAFPVSMYSREKQTNEKTQILNYSIVFVFHCVWIFFICP